MIKANDITRKSWNMSRAPYGGSSQIGPQGQSVHFWEQTDQLGPGQL